MQITKNDYSQLASRIPGWGIDLPPEARPGVPREKEAPQGTGAHWAAPQWQKPEGKILKTGESPYLTPVFGTTCPTYGISGRLREFSYRRPEGDASHWMLLLFADRIDVIESYFKEATERWVGIVVSFKRMRGRPQGRRHALLKGLGMAASTAGMIALAIEKSPKLKRSWKKKLFKSRVSIERMNFRKRAV